MQLDQLLDAAAKDKDALQERKQQLLEEIEKFRQERIEEIGSLEGQIKRIDKVLRAAGAEVNGSADVRRRGAKKKPGDPGYKYRQVGVELLQTFADAASKMGAGQFTRGELSRKAEDVAGKKLGEGNVTYAVRDLVALGWIKETPDPVYSSRKYLDWVGPKKPEVAPLVEERRYTMQTNAGPVEKISGWQFKDAATRKRAGMEK